MGARYRDLGATCWVFVKRVPIASAAAMASRSVWGISCLSHHAFRICVTAVTVAAGRDTFHHYRHEAGPAGEMDAAALEQHRAAVQMVYPEGFERGNGGQ